MKLQASSAITAEAALKLLFPDLSVLALAERLRLSSGNRIRGTMAGKRRSVTLGGSQEFADYRPYSPGDDTRRIDWNVYGRTGRAYVRQYWDEQELHAHLYVDASRSMSFAGGSAVSKLQYALRLAALVGFAALAGDDRVTVRAFDEQTMGMELPALQGRPAFTKLYRFLAGMFAEESRSSGGGATRSDRPDVGASDLTLPFGMPGALPRRAGVTWLFTDAMFESGLRETLLTLSSTGQQVVFVHLLSPEEVDPSLSGELKLVDSELGTGKEVAISEKLLREYRASVRAYQEQLTATCAELGASYVFLETGMSMTEALQRLLALPGGLKK
ncbi:DUF58 domain-containing protein [Paenibacillus soyae]|uniref:DUF58 domain-containing protein n=1 Tax=Paenibacillus soyae TaxID=2969249 RepID=A0A9X2MNZ3_9BACL|nr:DUF58 domain-containing protein [Paenibacillus soyae]MCR2805498.1 DUF58 domain-containing protein [Paenibacillus soyae]